MSKHIEKYPGLYAGCKRLGVGYQVMYQRVRGGMTVEAALAIPVAKCGRKPGVKQGPRPRTYVTTVPPWKRPDWVRVPVKRREVRVPVEQREVRVPVEVRMPVKRREEPRKRYTPKKIEDTSPDHIRKLRARFCDEFIKTGELNQALMGQLKEYADECRTAKAHLARVSDEPPGQDRGREEGDARNDGRAIAHEVDRRTAERLVSFLRTP